MFSIIYLSCTYMGSKPGPYLNIKAVFPGMEISIIKTVTVQTSELLLDRGWNWLDFPDFKHDYI